MKNSVLIVTLAVTVLCAVTVVSAGSLQGLRNRILSQKRSKHSKNGSGGKKLFFKGGDFPKETLATKHEDIVLECSAGGSPNPTIHWLKDGKRIKQGTAHDIKDDDATFEDTLNVNGSPLLRLASTKSKLTLLCVTRRDEAVYTCVAETPEQRISASTLLKLDYESSLESGEQCLEKRANQGSAARIYMWTVNRLEIEGPTVQFFCRAEGVPAPQITWLDRHSNVINGAEDSNYRILKNGDLLVRHITWDDNMGGYTCVAENPSGRETATTFLYPTT